MRITFIILFLASNYTACLFGQDTSRQINSNSIESYRNDNSFSYEEKPARENTLWLKFLDFLDDIFSSETLYVSWRIGRWIIAAIIIYILLRFILKMQFTWVFKKKETPVDKIQFILNEESLDADLEEIYKDAIDQHEYRLATRIKYLIFLKQLVTKDLIKWSPGKTSQEYLSEIQPDHVKQDFKKFTKLFNYIWYGEKEIDQSQYDNLKKIFEPIIKSTQQYAY